MAARGGKRKPTAPRGLAAADLAGEPPAEVRALADRIAADGGRCLAVYRDPLGGKWLLLAAVPIDRVEPTPYQRELSEAHAARLACVLGTLDRFLDPLILTAHEKGYWTPNGMHRLVAMKRLGARAVVGLVVPEPEIAYRILALNTEKAHNLRDRALEAVRMAKAIAAADDTARTVESHWAFEFEEPAYLTLGLCYEANSRFSGGAYLPILRRCEAFSERPVAASLADRASRAEALAELDAAVNDCVKRLKEAGFTHGYLKPFVVARLNPLRFQGQARPGQKAPRAEFAKTIRTMLAAARAFDAGKIRPQDFSAMAAAAAAGSPEAPFA